MNLASILPLAPTGTAGHADATATGDATGFGSILTATLGGDVRNGVPAGEGTAAPAEDEAAPSAQDLLTLTLLATRSAHATWPQITAAGATAVPLDPTVTTSAGDATVGATGEAPTPDVPAAAAADVAAAAADVAAEVAATLADAADEPLAGAVDASPDALPVAATDSSGSAARTSTTSARTVDDAGHTVAAPTTDLPATTQDPTVVDDVAQVIDDAAQVSDGVEPRITGADRVPADTVPTAAARTTATTEATEGPDVAPLTVDRAAPRAAAPDRVRGDAATAPTTTAPTSTDGAAAAAVDADAAVPTTATSGRSTPLASSSAAQRVLDVVAQLEDAPPPRVVVIETGEIRVRVGLDAGTVRLTVLGQLSDQGEDILREAADALAAGGFDTELDHPSGEDRHGDDEPDVWQPPLATTDGPAATTARAAHRPTGLRL